MRRIAFSLTLLLLAGCHGAEPGLPTTPDPDPAEPAFAPVELFADCPAAPVAVDLPAAVRDSIITLIQPNYFDGRLAIVARRVPGGFAGYWQGAGGRLTVGLVDPSQREAALAALHADTLLPHGIPLDAPVAPARWNFAQLVEWGRYLEDTIGREPDLVFVDSDEETNRLTVGVTSAAGRDRLIAALRARGAPCGLVRLEQASRAVVKGPGSNQIRATFTR